MSKSFVFCVNIFVLRKNGAYPAEKDTVTETSSPGHSITFSLNLYVHLLCPRDQRNALISNVKPTGHGITLVCNCTFAYRVREISAAR